jgi:hypothetical protein
LVLGICPDRHPSFLNVTSASSSYSRMVKRIN